MRPNDVSDGFTLAFCRTRVNRKEENFSYILQERQGRIAGMPAKNGALFKKQANYEGQMIF